MQRVLFVCTGNTCRSVMAEYIARRRFYKQLEVASAGIDPGAVDDAANAIYTLQRCDIDASGHRPRNVKDVNVADYDLIVAMDNYVAQEIGRLFPILQSERIMRWKINDPYGDDLEEYDRCAKFIHRELRRLVNLKEGAI